MKKEGTETRTADSYDQGEPETGAVTYPGDIFWDLEQILPIDTYPLFFGGFLFVFNVSQYIPLLFFILFF